MPTCITVSWGKIPKRYNLCFQQAYRRLWLKINKMMFQWGWESYNSKWDGITRDQKVGADIPGPAPGGSWVAGMATPDPGGCPWHRGASSPYRQVFLSFKPSLRSWALQTGRDLSPSTSMGGLCCFPGLTSFSCLLGFRTSYLLCP